MLQKLKVEKAEDKEGGTEVVMADVENKVAICHDSGMAVDSC